MSYELREDVLQTGFWLHTFQTHSPPVLLILWLLGFVGHIHSEMPAYDKDKQSAASDNNIPGNPYCAGGHLAIMYLHTEMTTNHLNISPKLRWNESLNQLPFSQVPRMPIATPVLPDQRLQEGGIFGVKRESSFSFLLIVLKIFYFCNIYKNT